MAEERIVVRPRGGRPPVGGATKTPISFRIHPGLLESLQRLAEEKELPYQSFMHDILSEEVSTIVNFERSTEREKIALMGYQLRQIAQLWQRECPSYAELGEELEEFTSELVEKSLGTPRSDFDTETSKEVKAS